MDNITDTKFLNDKKMRFFYVVIILLFGLNSCNPEVNYRNKFSIEELTSYSIDLYEPSSELKILLDSTINYVNRCSLYNDKSLGFITTFFQDSISTLFFVIENTTNKYEYDYTKCRGVYYYKGYQFVYAGATTDVFLKKNKNQVDIFYFNPKYLVKYKSSNDEFFHSSWEYIYEDNRFKCISYNDCGNYWYNKNYVFPE